MDLNQIMEASKAALEAIKEFQFSLDALEKQVEKDQKVIQDLVRYAQSLEQRA